LPQHLVVDEIAERDRALDHDPVHLAALVRIARQQGLGDAPHRAEELLLRARALACRLVDARVSILAELVDHALCPVDADVDRAPAGALVLEERDVDVADSAASGEAVTEAAARGGERRAGPRPPDPAPP